MSLELKVDSELAVITECGREFQVVGAVQRNARLEKFVLWKGADSSETVDECRVRVRPQSRAVGHIVVGYIE